MAVGAAPGNLKRTVNSCLRNLLVLALAAAGLLAAAPAGAASRCGAEGDWRSNLIPDIWPPPQTRRHLQSRHVTVRNVPVYKACMAHDPCYDTPGVAALTVCGGDLIAWQCTTGRLLKSSVFKVTWQALGSAQGVHDLAGDHGKIFQAGGEGRRFVILAAARYYLARLGPGHGPGTAGCRAWSDLRGGCRNRQGDERLPALRFSGGQVIPRAAGWWGPRPSIISRSRGGILPARAPGRISRTSPRIPRAGWCRPPGPGPGPLHPGR